MPPTKSRWLDDLGQLAPSEPAWAQTMAKNLNRMSHPASPIILVCSYCTPKAGQQSTGKFLRFGLMDCLLNWRIMRFSSLSKASNL